MVDDRRRSRPAWQWEKVWDRLALRQECRLTREEGLISENCAWLPFCFWNWKSGRHNRVVIGYVRLRISRFAAGGDRETASVAEGFGGNLQTGGGLLAFVLGAIDHANDAAHDSDVKTAVGGNLLRGM